MNLPSLTTNRQTKLGDKVLRISFLLADGTMCTLTCMHALGPSLFYTEQGGNKSFCMKSRSFLFINSKLQALAFLWKEPKFKLVCEEFGVHQKLLWMVGLKEDWRGEKTTPDKPVLGQHLMTGKDVQTINSTLFLVKVDELQQKTAY